LSPKNDDEPPGVTAPEENDPDNGVELPEYDGVDVPEMPIGWGRMELGEGEYSILKWS
jgi:hypothetical protein